MSNYYQTLSENIFKRMYSAFKNKLGSMRLEPPHPMDNAFTSAFHRKRDADPPSLQDIHPALGTDAKPKSGPKESPFWTNNPARARFKDAYRKKAAGMGRVPNPNYKEKEQAVEGTIMDYRTSIRALFEAVLLEGKTTGGDPEATGKRVGAFLNRPGNNTFKNFRRSNEILDKMKKRKSGKASNPNVTKPYFSGMRQGLGYQRDDASTNHSRDNLRALFEAVLNEEGFEYQKPGQLSKSKRNQAEYQDRKERKQSGRIVMRGGGNLLDKDLMSGAYRQAARGMRAIKDKSPHSVDRYGNPRSVPDTHTSMVDAHRKADREAKIAARQRRLDRKAKAAAKAQQNK